MPKSMTRSTITNNVWYKSMLVGNEAFVPEAMELISSTTTTASSVTFSSIPTDYSHLQIRITAKSSLTTATVTSLGLRINSDTSTNYAAHEMRALSNSYSANAYTSQTYSFLGRLSASQNDDFAPSSFIIDVVDYQSTTSNTTIRTYMGGFDYSLSYVALYSGVWLSTSVVSSVTLFPISGSFRSGSRFSLYGIKGG